MYWRSQHCPQEFRVSLSNTWLNFKLWFPSTARQACRKSLLVLISPTKHFICKKRRPLNLQKSWKTQLAFAKDSENSRHRSILTTLWCHWRGTCAWNSKHFEVSSTVLSVLHLIQIRNVLGEHWPLLIRTQMSWQSYDIRLVQLSTLARPSQTWRILVLHRAWNFSKASAGIKLLCSWNPGHRRPWDEMHFPHVYMHFPRIMMFCGIPNLYSHHLH